MPNHVTNRLIISGVNPERTAEIMGAISGYQHYKGDKALKEKPETIFRAIDFNKIVPMPETLNCTSGSSGETALLAVFGVNVNHYFPITQEEAQKRLGEMDEAHRKEALTLAETYKYNLDHYGHKDWYDWSCAKWGTKWNAYDISVENNEIVFDTAWSTPEPIIRAMSLLFPDARFTVSFADEDLGQNCGSYTYKKGRISKVYQPDGGSEEALRFACEVKGYDYDEEMSERNGDVEDEDEEPTAEEKLQSATEGLANSVTDLKKTLEDNGIIPAQN